MRLSRITSLAILLLLTLPAFAQVLPGKYVLQLDTEPLGVEARTRTLSSAAKNKLNAIQLSQQRAEGAVTRLRGRVVSRMQNLVNAVAVELPEENAEQLPSIPGVKRVFPVLEYHIDLDHALPLHKVPQAWNRIGGMANAGLGMKIGILDTGITPSHRAFQDPTLKVPAGYPIVSGPQNAGIVNNKIIVARDYQQFYTGVKNDSAIDSAGHGTNTADCAAGMPESGKFASVMGVAPKAFLGVYKIAPLNTGSASGSAIAQAIDDAFGDGMDVINISYGSTVSTIGQSLANYIQDQASKLGLIIVRSAGNSGSAPDTVFDGADGDNAISVGASSNDRTFGGSITLAGLPVIQSSPGNYPQQSLPLAGALNNVNDWDPGLGCLALPKGSLTGQIGLVTPGACQFQTILNNFQAAGAVAAIFYSGTTGAAALNWTPLAATLPGVYVSNKDGLTLKAAASGLPIVNMVFEGVPYAADNKVLASFSSRGPTELSGLKPDLVATGTNVYMTTQSLDKAGQEYDASGYLLANGTSYSAPLVAGAAAVLKGARPGLTPDQYRSLLINSANPMVSTSGAVERVQHVGSGVLNLDAAISSTVAVNPTSISFGTGSGNLNNFFTLAVTNVGNAPETFTVGSIPFDGAPKPVFSTDGSGVYINAPASPSLQISLLPKQTRIVAMLWTASRLGTGEYQGLVSIQGGTTGSIALVPYWYGVPDFIPAYLRFLSPATAANAGANVSIYYRVTDSIGTGITDNAILRASGKVAQGGGKITGPFESTSYLNFNYFVATLDTAPGTNVFQVTIAGLTTNFTITGNKVGAVPADGIISDSLPAVDYRIGAGGLELLTQKLIQDRP